VVGISSHIFTSPANGRLCRRKGLSNMKPSQIANIDVKYIRTRHERDYGGTEWEVSYTLDGETRKFNYVLNRHFRINSETKRMSLLNEICADNEAKLFWKKWRDM
jgi:hypothetical protein